ncbi:alpha/beta hydrolase [Catenuloplanes atrovinosus]|uniref:Pimeloyl-ACP methyl ester carboxylesterase n=1 Tax=Catenuloplanes atrovinosus TaxID=137266 RepID=A0AAE3YLX5_9ACTN|nr:alpha/beta hydrolase [Catenuloplanes atrovinosus]MDR7275422.1 pimeloyl-ACP methyl ester carboxylesterase [Catenuloplanes atrovinosus]
MSGRLRRVWAAVMLGAGALFVPGPAHATAPPVSWADCADGLECATVPVPLDHDEPRGPAIGIALIRLPATDPDRRIGSLLVNPGGPGGSGVDFVRWHAAAMMPAEIRARFDVVGFDPRGVARSAPLLCFDSLDDALAAQPERWVPDDVVAQERAQRASDEVVAAACARRGGPIREHMSTADTARDLDLLRAALGDRALTFLGYSYGSVIGQTYANLFPSRVRALVVDGVMDPVAWTTGHGREGTRVPVGHRGGAAGGAEATLEEFFRLCDAAGPGCALSGGPGAARRFAEVTARLRAGPVEVVDPFGGDVRLFTYDEWLSTMRLTLNEPGIWASMAEFFADLAGQIGPATARVSTPPEAPEAPEWYENIVEGTLGVTCADSVNPRAFADWQRAADDAERRYGYFGRTWSWNWSACAVWRPGAAQDRYAGPWSARTAAPVLIVGNHYDPATPYHGAVAASRLLPHSRLLTHTGWGHAAAFLLGNDCVDGYVTDYLISGRTPPRGATCAPEGSPFTLAAAGHRAQADVARPAPPGGASG